jgi:hypothetical protein
MSAWMTLLQKEFRMTRNSALLSLAVLLVGGLWLVYLSYNRSLGIVFAPAAMLLVLLMFYPAIFMLRSLTWEWKVTPHLWLHCPQPAWMLLAAKLAIALLQMLAIIIVTALLLLLGISISPQVEQQTGFSFSSLLPVILEAGTYAAVFAVAAGIYIGAWATLISVANALAGSILGRFRWLAGIAVFAVATVGLGWLQQTWFYKQITNWGAIDVRLYSLRELFPAHTNTGQIFTGDILIFILLTVGLYALSAWLIDHKVEV